MLTRYFCFVLVVFVSEVFVPGVDILYIVKNGPEADQQGAAGSGQGSPGPVLCR
jgi:hypothetical protein